MNAPTLFDTGGHTYIEQERDAVDDTIRALFRLRNPQPALPIRTRWYPKWENLPSDVQERFAPWYPR